MSEAHHTERIYFDHSTTTPLDPRVADAMLLFYRENFGNPSSLHLFALF
jgi:cysteine desulfurase